MPVPQQRPQQGPPCGSFLVTGGLGSLGLLSARWLLASVGDASALHLVLQGRSGRGAAAAQLAAHCGSLWAVLHLQRGDAASSQESCWGMQARLQVVTYALWRKALAADHLQARFMALLCRWAQRHAALCCMRAASSLMPWPPSRQSQASVLCLPPRHDQSFAFVPASHLPALTWQSYGLGAR